MLLITVKEFWNFIFCRSGFFCSRQGLNGLLLFQLAHPFPNKFIHQIVQTLLIKPILHKELYDLVASDDDDENIKLLKSLFIKNAITHLSIARSVYKLTAIIGQNNTIAIFDNTANNYGKTHKTAPIEILEKFKEEAEKQGQFYLSEMVAYIKANPDDYPTYPHATPIDFTEDDDHLIHTHPRIVVF